MTSWLLDTGPQVTALNRRDPHHSRCASVLGSFSGSLLTTEAVVTEAMPFLGGLPDGAETFAGFLEDAQVDIRDCFAPLQLHAAARLMQKYADTPMDFADANLFFQPMKPAWTTACPATKEASVPTASAALAASGSCLHATKNEHPRPPPAGARRRAAYRPNAQSFVVVRR
ncbi:MAG: hypothetical protein CK548_06465 [Opitutia bacterium]|nr:hypothetical protein [Opitutaceae bacterium]PHX71535.1 MAG: hypothetical protein CK548_06465 [Opitutae bacterium]